LTCIEELVAFIASITFEMRSTTHDLMTAFANAHQVQCRPSDVVVFIRRRLGCSTPTNCARCSIADSFLQRAAVGRESGD